ncbi:cytochrome c family protein [Zavarzinia sp.]|uniref:c-type cytochrome n=1 Tax=Zavarzinia sp. TaxID=2027920 RepID=UPI003569DF0B
MRLVLATTLLSILLPAAASAEDAAAGEKVFMKCKICHQIGEGAKTLVGPELNGIVGRKSGSIEGFAYSPAMKDSGITWTEDQLSEYLKNPKLKVPNNKMAFVGLTKPEDIANVIAYLKQFDATGKKAP